MFTKKNIFKFERTYLVLFFKEIVAVTFLLKLNANLIFIKAHGFCF